MKEVLAKHKHILEYVEYTGLIPYLHLVKLKSHRFPPDERTHLNSEGNSSTHY